MFRGHEKRDLVYFRGINLNKIGFWYTLGVSILVTYGVKWRFSIVLGVVFTQIQTHLGKIKNLVSSRVHFQQIIGVWYTLGYEILKIWYTLGFTIWSNILIPLTLYPRSPPWAWNKIST